MTELTHGTVIVPQFPTMMGSKGPERRPIDLTDAERYGVVQPVLGDSAKPWDQSSLDQLDAWVDNSDENDWLLCIGNPVLIATAAAAFALRHERLNVLQWQSRKRRYEAICIDYNAHDIVSRVVTLREDEEIQ